MLCCSILYLMKRCIFEIKASPGRADNCVFSACRTWSRGGWGLGVASVSKCEPMWLLLRLCQLGGVDRSCKGNVCPWVPKCPAIALYHPPQRGMWKPPLCTRSSKASHRSKIHSEAVCCSAVNLRVFH